MPRECPILLKTISKNIIISIKRFIDSFEKPSPHAGIEACGNTANMIMGHAVVDRQESRPFRIANMNALSINLQSIL